mmetsp:Transcript_3054/g.5553  ORF Transcript_3054/g.5553 Transcript_3054/m.5553 type:complete len:164 (-) Transcript_3054:1744-2235(-)
MRCLASPRLQTLALLLCWGACAAYADPLCSGNNHLAGGFRQLDFENDVEVSQEVDTIARVAVGLIDQQGLSSFGVNTACPGDGMPPMLATPTVLDACAQVVAGTIYRLRFTAPVECRGLNVANTALVEAEVFQPLPFLVGGSPEEPTLRSATIQLTPEHITQA